MPGLSLERIQPLGKNTPMPRAFDTLVNKGKENDLECLKCHVTGAGTNLGFGDLKSTPELINVQCEVCHGPGYDHAAKPDKNYGSMTPSTCIKCHDKKNDPTFKYEEKSKKVMHNQ